MVLSRTVATQCDLCLDDVSARYPTMREDSPCNETDPITISGDPANDEQFFTVAEVLVLLGEADRVSTHGIQSLTERKRLIDDLEELASSRRGGRLNSSCFDDNPFGPQMLHRELVRRGDGFAASGASSPGAFDDLADGEVVRCYRDVPLGVLREAAEDVVTATRDVTTANVRVPPLHPPPVVGGAAAAVPSIGLQAVKSVASSCSLGSWAYVFTPRTPTHAPLSTRPDYVHSNASDSPVSVPSPAKDGSGGGTAMAVRRPPRAPHRFGSGAAESHEASILSRQSSGTPPLSPYNRASSSTGVPAHASAPHASAASSSSSSASRVMSRNHSPRDDAQPHFPCALFLEPSAAGQSVTTLPPRRLNLSATVAHFSKAFYTAETNLSDLWHVVVAALTDGQKRSVLLRRARQLVADAVSTISSANEPAVALVVQFRASSFVQWCSSRLTTTAVHLSW